MLKRIIPAVARRLGIALARYPAAGTFAGELDRLLKNEQVNVFLDIGAHLGESTRLVRSLGFSGRIIAFEPDEECLSALRESAAADPACEVLPVALGAKSGTATLLRMDCSGLSSLHTPLASPGGGSLRAMTVTGSRTVQVRTLEDFLRNELRSVGDVIAKIDTQGSDLDVMDGAGEERQRIAAAVLEAPIIELYDGMHSLDQTLDRMREWGYHATGIVPVSRDARGRILEVDVFFKRTRGSV